MTQSTGRMAQTDEDLMSGVRQGDLRSLGPLFERHHVHLFNFLLRLTGDRAHSEDLVQDVFFRILRYRQTYRDGTSFTTWMYQIARNARVDALRKKRPEVGVELETLSPADARPTPADRAESTQQEELLRRSLSLLPEEKRELLVLSRYQNLPHDQIAELLHCEVSTVKVRVFRAVQELKKIYQGLLTEHKRTGRGAWAVADEGHGNAV